MFRLKWLLMVILLLFSATASAEFFKYRDQDGNIIYTDDITRVPREQQSAIQKYKESRSVETRVHPQAVPGAEEEPGPTLSESTSPAGSREVLEDDRQILGKDLDEEERALDKRKQDLDQEYQALLKEKETFDRNKVFRNKEAAARYNRRVVDLNDRIDSYEEKKKELNADIEAYNTRVKKRLETGEKK